MGCFVTWQGPRFKDEKGESPIDGLGRPGWILVDISTLVGFGTIINHPFWRVFPLFLETPICYGIQMYSVSFFSSQLRYDFDMCFVSMQKRLPPKVMSIATKKWPPPLSFKIGPFSGDIRQSSAGQKFLSNCVVGIAPAPLESW